MIYTCQRCGYVTEFTSHFKKHINAKKICEPSLTDISKEQLLASFLDHQNNKNFTCDQCNKKYKTVETLRVHKKTCSSTQSHPTHIINNNINTTNNNNIQVNIQINAPNNIPNIRDFLNENMEYITDEFIMKCAKKLDHGLIELIKNVRFNPEYPENMNIKLHTKRDKTLYVFKNNRWEICDGNTTLESMIIQGARIINQSLLTNTDAEKMLDEDSYESKIQSWLLSILPKDNIRVLNKLSKSIYAMILDNQQLVVMEK